MRSNAKQIPSSQSINLLRFVFFQELTESEFKAYKELVKQQKDDVLHDTRMAYTGTKPEPESPMLGAVELRAGAVSNSKIQDAVATKRQSRLKIPPDKNELLEVKEPDTIEQITERIKQYEPPTRRLTQEERHAEILKRFNKDKS